MKWKSSEQSFSSSPFLKCFATWGSGRRRTRRLATARGQTDLTLLPPAELTDETLTAKLWELLHNLACTGFYVLHTDHLSDRELYAELWTRGLCDETLLPGKIRTGGWYHDFIGSGSEEDIQRSLRYYDTDDERADWARQWPNDIIPPKEKPPFNRDWHLPKGPF